MQLVIGAVLRGVRDGRSFFSAEDGAVSLDWMTVTAGSVVLAVALVAAVGDEAMGLVDRMADQDAAHQRAVLEMQTRRQARQTAEPRMLYYPDSPDLPTAMGPVEGASGVAVAMPRDSGGQGAFEPEIAEPARSSAGDLAVPKTVRVEASAGVSIAERATSATCKAEADSPWVTDSLRANCD